MTPYIIALAVLALLLAWSAKDCERYRGNGYQPKGQNAQHPKVIGTCVNVEEDEKGVKFTILLAGDQTEHADKERQKSKTKDFAKSSTPKKHGSTLRHTTAKNNKRRKDDIS